MSPIRFLIRSRPHFWALQPTVIPSYPCTFNKTLPRSMSSTRSPPSNPPTETESQTAAQQLALPSPEDVQNLNQLEVNGKDLKLDALGPVVVNENGTLSRIDNWAEMADIEKANVRRILLKRNEQRLKRLREQAAAAENKAE